MTLTEREIMSQHEALQKTVERFSGLENDMRTFFQTHDQKKFIFIGCGSSYMLSKSFAALFLREKGAAAAALPGGDLLLAPGEYDEPLRDSVAVPVSRSGETSEIVRALTVMRKRVNFSVLSLVMKEGSALEGLSDFSVILPWACDESVCQTRCVTNLYTAGLLLYGYRFGKEGLITQIKAAADANGSFKALNRPALEKAAGWGFDKVVVLADGPLCGIAEEGALAFTEIAMMPSAYYHPLDYRHGPIVLSDPRTLTIMILRREESLYQNDMAADIKKHGGYLITFGKGAYPGSDLHIPADETHSFETWGISFIYLCQMIALAKSLLKGLDPDKPAGLDAYIQL